MTEAEVDVMLRHEIDLSLMTEIFVACAHNNDKGKHKQMIMMMDKLVQKCDAYLSVSP